jgi:sialate O-acetylesterase
MKIAAAALLFAALPAHGENLLNPVFQDHAVLQRDQPIRVWGMAAPGAAVTAAIGRATALVTADGSGHWRAELPGMAAGGPYTLSVNTNSGMTQTVSDILIGDVYLCSGQSNMAFAVSGAVDAGPDIQIAANDGIRLMNVANVSKALPQRAIPAGVSWAAASPKTVPNFSASCYFFGRALQKSVHVPLGLIAAPWSGANITDFMRADALQQAGGQAARLEALKIYAADPAAGVKHWDGIVESFWRGQGKALWTSPASGTGWAEAPKGLGVWSTWGVPELQKDGGTVWFRTTVTLTAAQAAQGAELALGPVTEEDTVWINGKAAGTTTGYGAERKYALSNGVLQEGANDILINVYCGWRGCGLIGPDTSRVLRLADGSLVPLNGSWKYAIEPTQPPQVPWGPTAGLTMDYNGMIAPLAPYGLKGVVWYQGESNAGQPQAYRGLLKAWMTDWRSAFEAPKLPFLIVQLPDYGQPPFAPEQSNWASLRESQRLAVSDDGNAALAVTIDIGDHMGLHPGNKQEVGRRLALQARRLIYGDASVKTGPQPSGAAIKGAVVTVTFGGINGKLAAVNAPQPIGFELCDATCHFAAATIAGDRVRLTVPKGLKPTKVRYCWGDGPVCTLYDSDRIPAVPFELSIAAGPK